ncbi:hypothetical protein BHE74_00000673 [Ensete ventricosum]|nr:hypothetical protein BHE74_00000673 [Ensete ventricosum]RZR94724.1 hypothetical protein BHM03_00023471 [Ensete ventricosum]
MGAAYGTAKSGVGVASMGVMRPELVMKSIVPVVMAGVLGIYGLIIAVIISTGINPKAKSYYLFDGYAHLSSGLACGLAGLSAGMAIGIVGDAGVRANLVFGHGEGAQVEKGYPWIELDDLSQRSATTGLCLICDMLRFDLGYVSLDKDVKPLNGGDCNTPD